MERYLDDLTNLLHYISKQDRNIKGTLMQI